MRFLIHKKRIEVDRFEFKATAEEIDFGEAVIIGVSGGDLKCRHDEDREKDAYNLLDFHNVPLRLESGIKWWQIIQLESGRSNQFLFYIGGFSQK